MYTQQEGLNINETETKDQNTQKDQKGAAFN